MVKRRFTLTVDIHLFLIKQEKILLLKRKNTSYMDDYWHLPAGHLEEGEKAVEALIRESKEEIGIAIDPKDAQLVHVMHHKSNNERIGLFFEVKRWKGKIENMEPEKHSQVRWFDLEKLPANIVPYAQAAIKSYKKGIIFSHYGWG